MWVGSKSYDRHAWYFGANDVIKSIKFNFRLIIENTQNACHQVDLGKMTACKGHRASNLTTEKKQTPA